MPDRSSPASEPRPVLVWDADGTCHLDFGPMNEGFREALCGVCREPIEWCMDMFSFQIGNYPRRLVHARCAWKPAAFRRQGRLAARRGDGEDA